MTDTARPARPQRDEAGRIIRLTDLLGLALGGLVISALGIVAIDAVFALLGAGKFGDLTGWLAMIYPTIIFVEQFGAARGAPGRFPVALIGVLAAFGLGALAAGVGPHLPALASGAVAALVATVVYAIVWHVGLTLFANRT